MEPAVTKIPGAVLASSPLIFLTSLRLGLMDRAFAGSLTVNCFGFGSPGVAIGLAVTVPILVCWTPGSGAGYEAVQVIDSPIASFCFGQAIFELAIISSVTITESRAISLVLVIIYSIFKVVPAATSTPGAVFASTPLIFLTNKIEELVITYALAVSVAFKSGKIDPSESGGTVALTLALLVCCTPGAGAARVALQVMLAPTANNVAGQTIEEAGILSSVTTTGLRSTLPVLLTSKVIFIVEPAATKIPGAVLASSPLIFLIILILGLTDKALAGLVEVTTTGVGIEGIFGGKPVAVAVFVCPIPAAGALKTALQVIVSAGANQVFGQVISAVAILSSVTLTGSSLTSPVLVTSKVTFILVP